MTNGSQNKDHEGKEGDNMGSISKEEGVLKRIISNKKVFYPVLGVILLSVWLFGYFIPRQNCISNITGTSDGDSYLYLSDSSSNEFFSARDDALDYCMAERWGF